MKKRSVVVTTGTRADYGILRPILDEITNSRLHTCLTMLAFEKDKMQVEQQLIKNAKR